MRMSRKRQGLAGECTQIAPTPLEWGGYIIRPNDPKHADIHDAPNEPGIYAWYSRAGYLLYVGKSVRIATRLRQHQERTCFFATPSLFSWRLVPQEYMSGVENAHIDMLNPRENNYRDSYSTPFQDDLEKAIEAAWAGALPAQREYLGAAYARLAEQIAARL